MGVIEELKEYAKGLGCQDDVLSFIEKRYTDQSINDFEHIIDFLVSNERPKRLDRATYIQMKLKSEKWIESLNKKSDLIDDSNGFETVLDFGDGFKFVKLISEDSYKKEGFLMRHCVASYYDKGVEIYSLRDKQNNPHCTVEKDKQIKGKGNGNISPKYIDYVVRFLEWAEMKVRDNEMKNLGYEKEIFPEYVLNKKDLFRNKYYRVGVKIEYLDSVIVFKNINEAVLYKGNKISLFKGSADFRNSQIKDLGQLQSIGGYAYFSDSQIKDLGQLRSIGGDAYFSDSQIKDLGQLQSIGGNAFFSDSQIKDLGQLRSIGGYADFRNSQIKDLGQLQSIGDYADFRNSQVTNLGQLQSMLLKKGV